ncbi:MAG: GNAT family N-acetyltransferase [Alphaproteobacteria bacterium]
MPGRPGCRAAITASGDAFIKMTLQPEPTRQEPRGEIILRAVGGASHIGPDEWNACAGADDPFLSHGFFRALEASGSASAETGWLPQHLIAEREGRVLGILPLYLKSHSFGEYVFDQGWAEAYERAGGRYYPKLQGGVPFTPVTGRRLLVRTGVDARPVEDALIEGSLALTERLGASSLHVIFPGEAEWRRLSRAGFLPRTGLQFHWRNEAHRHFDDFLSTLSSRKRKAIRKERRAAQAIEGIAFETLIGLEITERHWDAFDRCYRATSEGKWGYPYLTRAFFSHLGERLGSRVVLMLASRAGRTIAGALHLLGSDALYGRNWGSIEHHRFLHFELCYYRAIELAIEKGLARVEAGAQGGHKLARGYLPVPTYSAHWIREPALKEAVARYLDQERRQVGREIGFLETFAPFRKS